MFIKFSLISTLIYEKILNNGVAKAMFDVITKAQIFEGWKLDFLILGKSSYEIEEIVCELHKILSPTVPIIIYRGKHINITDTNSAVILTKSSKYLNKFESSFRFSTRQRKNLNIFVYCEKIENKIESFNVMRYSTVRASMFEYFFIKSKIANIIELQTISWFSDKICNHGHFVNINSYNIYTQKWIKKLEIKPKFSNFYSCKLYAGFNESTYYFHYIRKFGNKIERFGIIPMMIEILAKLVNFTYSYKEYSFAMFENINRKEDNLNIFIHQKQTIALPSLENIPVIETSSIVFVIPPGELYTIYEKLFLPFDRTIWILLGLTFHIAFLIIFILNFVKKEWKLHFYGLNVNAPALNVLSIFFGISVTKFPIRNTPRFILALFVLFCLVFQTCYQSKLFEFMTSEMRKPEIQTINELDEKEFTIHASIIFKETLKNFSSWPSSRVEYAPSSIPKIVYKFSEISTTNERIAIISTKDIVLINEFKNNVKYKILNEPLITTGVTLYSHYYNNFLSELFYETLRLLLPSGIPYNFIQSHREIFYKISKEIDDIEPQVLSLYDLDFGFFIWLPFVGVSIIVFLLELIFRPKKLKIVKIKFAKIHPMPQGNIDESEVSLTCEDMKISEEKKTFN
ncbi:hypothetical protein PVAND_006116 [Polypedilum vanderplanki]|uniref:Ionotropic glutamate receptor C-terminal domain-containing protein n=1 Tax=Polypedilum vanderplanki TaxID=319348 RepID=A0A9J6C260_POLVA|nr:hypothetical protein PVAND_006116 [Polypedilum vanderplanki]